MGPKLWLHDNDFALFKKSSDLFPYMALLGSTTWGAVYFAFHALALPFVMRFTPSQSLAECDATQVKYASSLVRLLHALVVNIYIFRNAILSSIVSRPLFQFRDINPTATFYYEPMLFYLMCTSLGYYVTDILSQIKRSKHEYIKDMPARVLLRNACMIVILALSQMYPCVLSFRLFFLLSLAELNWLVDGVLDLIGELKMDLLKSRPRLLPILFLVSTLLGVCRVVLTFIAPVITLHWLQLHKPWRFEGLPVGVRGVSGYYSVAMALATLAIFTQEVPLFMARVKFYNTISANKTKASSGSGKKGKADKGVGGKKKRK